MQPQHTNNRCPNCGAPLPAGTDAANCSYCGQQKITEPVYETQQQAEEKAGPQPITTNLPWYFIAIIAISLLSTKVDKGGNMEYALMVISVVVVFLFTGSLAWFIIRWVKRLFTN